MKFLVLLLSIFVSCSITFLFNYFVKKNKKVIKIVEKLEEMKFSQKNPEVFKEYLKVISMYSIVLIFVNSIIFFLTWFYIGSLTIYFPKLLEVSWQYFYIFASIVIIKIYNEAIKI